MNYTKIYNFIEPVSIALIGGLVASSLTYWFKRKSYNKDFILGKTYEIHKKLLNELVNFFYETNVFFDFEGYQKNKILKDDLRKAFKMRFDEYCEEAPKSLFQDIHKIRDIKKYITKFESWIENIKEVSYLSNKKTRKIAKKIVIKYLETKSEESLFLSNVAEEINYDKGVMEEKYYEYQNNIYWEFFWVEIIDDLKKLKNNLEKFVALK